MGRSSPYHPGRCSKPNSLLSFVGCQPQELMATSKSSNASWATLNDCREHSSGGLSGSQKAVRSEVNWPGGWWVERVRFGIYMHPADRRRRPLPDPGASFTGSGVRFRPPGSIVVRVLRRPLVLQEEGRILRGGDGEEGAGRRGEVEERGEVAVGPGVRE